MAKADGSFVERNAKEREKKNTLERGALPAALLLLVAVLVALPAGLHMRTWRLHGLCFKDAVRKDGSVLSCD